MTVMQPEGLLGMYKKIARAIRAVSKVDLTNQLKIDIFGFQAALEMLVLYFLLLAVL